jgi:hypothetical protein
LQLHIRCAGYDKKGYDKYGYGKEGYDYYGYSKDGYDKYGYHREGFHKDGYGKEGYDKYSYDKYGYGKEGECCCREASRFCFLGHSTTQHVLHAASQQLLDRLHELALSSRVLLGFGRMCRWVDHVITATAFSSPCRRDLSHHTVCVAGIVLHRMIHRGEPVTH